MLQSHRENTQCGNNAQATDSMGSTLTTLCLNLRHLTLTIGCRFFQIKTISSSVCNFIGIISGFCNNQADSIISLVEYS